MRILITAAEQEELDCAALALRKYRGGSEHHKVDLVLTGIGVASTAYKVTKQIYLARQEGQPYDVAVNIGLAGSYDLRKFPLGSAGVIEAEHFGDLGIELDTSAGFQTLFDYKILESETFPYKGGALLRSMTMANVPADGDTGLLERIESFAAFFPNAVGVTVQTFSGNPQKVETVHSKFSPQIESMEGAAFYYVCIWEHLPALELRSISNEVGERDRTKWDASKALKALEAGMELFFRTLL